MTLRQTRDCVVLTAIHIFVCMLVLYGSPIHLSSFHFVQCARRTSDRERNIFRFVDCSFGRCCSWSMLVLLPFIRWFVIVQFRMVFELVLCSLDVLASCGVCGMAMLCEIIRSTFFYANMVELVYGFGLEFDFGCDCTLY